MTATHDPVRTCIGCRGKGSRRELVRYVRVPDDGAGADGARSVVRDERACMPGRGAWLHDSDACREQAVRRRALGRALRITGGAGTIDVSW